VPPGAYSLVHAEAGSDAVLPVFIGRGESPIAMWDVRDQSHASRHLLRVPCEVNAVVIGGGPGSEAAHWPVTLRPVEVWNGRGCPEGRARRANRYGPSTVFFFDDNSYVEEGGFWVRGKAGSVVAVDPGGQAAVAQLRVRSGGSPVGVRLASASWIIDLSLGEWEERDVDVPTDKATRTAVVTITTDGGFVPATVDPASTDRRFLGCWISVP
jgi:hypothetical protein